MIRQGIANSNFFSCESFLFMESQGSAPIVQKLSCFKVGSDLLVLGKKMLKRLKKEGIRCTLILDAAVG